MAIDLSKYRSKDAQKRALELLTPVKEDRTYLRLRKSFIKGCDKWSKSIQDGGVKGVRGAPENFFSTAHKRWTALGNDGQLVTHPRVGSDVLDSTLTFNGTPDETLSFLKDVRGAAEEGQFDDRFKELATAGGGAAPRRTRRKAK